MNALKLQLVLDHAYDNINEDAFCQPFPFLTLDMVVHVQFHRFNIFFSSLNSLIIWITIIIKC